MVVIRDHLALRQLNLEGLFDPFEVHEGGQSRAVRRLRAIPLGRPMPNLELVYLWKHV